MKEQAIRVMHVGKGLLLVGGAFVMQCKENTGSVNRSEASFTPKPLSSTLPLRLPLRLR